MSKKNKGGFTPRTEPAILPTPSPSPPESPSTPEEALEAVDPQVAIAVANLEGVTKLSIDTEEPPVFEEPEQVTSVEVPHAHPVVEEVSPKADTLPPEAPDTEDERTPLPEGVRQLTEEEVRKGYEDFAAANPGYYIIDVLHPRLKEMVPFLAKEVSVDSVLELRPAAQALLKREKEKGTPTTSEGIIQFESTSFALWLVDPGTPVPPDAKLYFHKYRDVITILWGNRIALQATEQEL